MNRLKDIPRSICCRIYQSNKHSFSGQSQVKTPIVLQMEAVECGAAALGIVLAYYGLFISLEELRVACGVSRDGSKALNMVKAARSYGFLAQGAQGEPEALKDLHFPFIVFWKFNHFVVVEDIQAETVYINDPATGRRRVTSEAFDKAFTGVAITLEPGPDFKTGGFPPSLVGSLKNRFLSSLSAINFLILISLALIIPGIIIPGFSKIFIDDILLAGTQNWLILLLIGFCLTAILRAILSAMQQYYCLRLNMKLMITGSAQLLWHALRLPITFFEQRYAGDILERLGANDRIATILSSNVSSSVVSVITMIFFAIIMFIYDWRLTVIGLVTVVLNGIIFYWVSSRLTDTSRQFLQDRGKLSGIEINGLRSIETLKSTALDNVFFKRWSGNHAKIIGTQQQLSLYNLLISILPNLLSGISSVLILYVGSYRVIEGFLTIGTLIAFQSLLASFNGPLTTLLAIGSKIQEIPGDIARIEDVLHQAEDARFAVRKEKTDFVPLSSETGVSIVMKDITFGYSLLDPPLIQHFNLSLKVGGQVALVGATGSGKSTIAKLITGLYSPWSGTIEINGQALSSLTSQNIAENLALVDQDILLFEGSVRDNLTLWDPKISVHELERATKDACAYEFLLHRPKLFDAPMEERGANFSGGECQRLEIARALVTNPKILILDEGTAALDSLTEQKIVTNLRSCGYSLLMITHRLSTIRDSDEIIVLDKGVICERGTHEELMKQKQHYAELIAKVS